MASSILSLVALFKLDIIFVNYLLSVTHLIHNVSFGSSWVLWVFRKYCVILVCSDTTRRWVNFIWSQHLNILIMIINACQVGHCFILWRTSRWLDSLSFIYLLEFFRDSVLVSHVFLAHFWRRYLLFIARICTRIIYKIWRNISAFYFFNVREVELHHSWGLHSVLTMKITICLEVSNIFWTWLLVGDNINTPLTSRVS